MSEKIFQAIELAMEAHRGQYDKCGVPYIAHPVAVMFKCCAHGEDETIAAVLHDVVEDTYIQLDVIFEMFGPRVGEAVDALSRRDGETYWNYIRRCCKNRIARRVKIADLEHNMEPARQFASGKKYVSMMDQYRQTLEFVRDAESNHIIRIY